MSKVKKKITKNIKQVNERKQKKYPFKEQVLGYTKILYTILIVSIVLYVFTSLLKGQYLSEKKETLINYETILAGQSFSRAPEKYYVVFYEFDEEVDLTTTISNLSSGAKIYKVDLGSAMNKNVINDKSNPKASEASELQINGTTLIVIENNKNIEYIEGTEKVTNYLNGI